MEQLDDITKFAGNLMARMPDKCSRLPAMLANQRNIGSATPYPVKYRTTNAHAQGRCYAWTPHAAFRASKALRTLAAGNKHVELDVVGAHLTLALVISPTLARTFRWGSVTGAREALVERFTGTKFATDNPTYYKDILTRSLNVDKRRHIAMLGLQGLFFGEPLVRDILSIIEEAKPEIVAQAEFMGFNRYEPRVNEANVVYFALEFVEGLFMRTFIACILQSTQVSSIVWIHDGILVRPSPSPTARTEATRNANNKLQTLLLRHTGMTSKTTVVMGCQTLNHARDEIIKFIHHQYGNVPIRPGPAESQDELEQFIHEYDYSQVENGTDPEQRVHPNVMKRHVGKRKLPVHDSMNNITQYFKRQCIVPS